ncbi:GAF domain-containing protein [Herpetosiphon gulosus]|uniref:histidine kinase n=1 Tax=Herpetosiphon gulosus TaxID=1973496 RepID=A0ABP9WWD5_9CHLR
MIDTSAPSAAILAILQNDNAVAQAQELRAFGATWQSQNADPQMLTKLGIEAATQARLDPSAVVTDLLLGYAAAREEQRTRHWQNHLMRRVQQLDGLHRIISAANSTLDIDASLQTVVDTVSDVMRVDVCSIYLFDQHRRMLRLVATRGLNPKAIGTVEVEIGVGVTGWAGELGKPVAIFDVRNEPRYQLEPLLEEWHFRSLLAVPVILFASERHHIETLQGVITVQNRDPHEFSQEQTSYLEVVAGEIALSIANAQMYQQTDARLHQKIRELTTLQRVTAALASTLDVDTLLHLIVEQAVKIADVDRTDIFQVRPNNKVKMLASYGPGRTSGVEDMIVQVIREHRAIAVPNAYTDERWSGVQAIAYREGFHSLFALPMRTGNRIIGALCFYSYAPRHIEYEQVQLLTTFADEGAIAIENARLYEETQRNLTIKSTLLQEIHHRVRNNLQTISALLQMQARRLNTETEGRQALDDSVRRIHAIAAVHNLLSHDGEGQTTVQDIAKQIAENIQMSLPSETPVEFLITGDSVSVNARAATVLAIVINELVHNALDHGLSAEGGIIGIDGWMENDEQACVQVRDDGPTRPEPVKRRVSTGLGLGIIETLVNTDLGGKFEFKREIEWTRALITFAPDELDD